MTVLSITIDEQAPVAVHVRGMASPNATINETSLAVKIADLISEHMLQFAQQTGRPMQVFDRRVAK